MSVRDLVEEHDRLRASGINLVVSENAPSQNVRRALASDLAGRYGDAWYGGSGPAERLQGEVESLARELFGVDHAIVTSLSGNVCDLAVLHAFTDPGDGLAMVPEPDGGYPLGCAMFHRERLDLPMTGHHVPDPDDLPAFLEGEDPATVILGSSYIPFPHPVSAARDAWDGPLVFDGAHVMGLLATDTFQDPLGEGADVLIGSTHKSLPGPQGGLVLTDDPDHAETLRRYLAYHEETGVGLVDNAHPSRIAALGTALEEIGDRPDYGREIQENSRTLAQALDEHGLPVRFADRGYTESHQVLLDLDDTRGRSFCRELEDQHIFVDCGGRVGTAEATWRGMGLQEMHRIAELMARVWDGDTDGVRKEAEQLAREFPAP